jgi:hypothetical protein
VFSIYASRVAFSNGYEAPSAEVGSIDTNSFDPQVANDALLCVGWKTQLRRWPLFLRTETQLADALHATH